MRATWSVIAGLTSPPLGLDKLPGPKSFFTFSLPSRSSFRSSLQREMSSAKASVGKINIQQKIKRHSFGSKSQNIPPPPSKKIDESISAIEIKTCNLFTFFGQVALRNFFTSDRQWKTATDSRWKWKKRITRRMQTESHLLTRCRRDGQHNPQPLPVWDLGSRDEWKRGDCHCSWCWPDTGSSGSSLASSSRLWSTCIVPRAMQHQGRSARSWRARAEREIGKREWKKNRKERATERARWEANSTHAG